jgi:cytoskeletal protein CcmA (bactofilin family)
MLFNKKPEEESGPSDFLAKRISNVSAPPEVMTNPPRTHNGVPTRSVIDGWLTITGDLRSEGEVQVDGRIHGDISCAHLTVGRDAIIDGNVTAEEVVVRGNVKGVIRANRVILQDSARVESEVFHKTLAIEEGAQFEGRSRRCDDPMSAEIAPRGSDLKAMAADMRATQKSNGKRSEAEAAVA